MEEVVLTAALTTRYKVIALSLYWDGASSEIKVTLRAPNGLLSWQWSGATAQTLITQLNKVDLSTKSLHKRIIERLIADGVITGTIEGVPD